MKYWRKPFDLEEKAIKPPRVLIDEARCKGCAYCVEFCPRGVLIMSTELSQKGYTLAEVEDEGMCLGCGLCSVLCPEFAIELSPSNTEEN